MDKKKLRKPSLAITTILAENIRNFRQKQKISQEDLANICGLHRTYVGSIERGERNATLSTLEALAAALDTNIPRLLTPEKKVKANLPEHIKFYIYNLSKSGLSIYDEIEIGDPVLWIPSPELETILDTSLCGIKLSGLPLRTRSKVVKEYVCSALGYPVPKSFQKTQPRFPGQKLDTYVQKSNNLQIWNEELDATRRYVLISLSPNDEITKVKVVTGEDLALLDTTGTLTQKYQARLIPSEHHGELITDTDTNVILPSVNPHAILNDLIPIAPPTAGSILPIKIIFDRLIQLIGTQFPDNGHNQERNRGAALHSFVCKTLGYSMYRDNGRFPDIRNQLLEVKLQTSPTIDLGLVCPDNTTPLEIPKLQGQQIRHCDVRYALFYAQTDGKMITITHLFLTTGEMFFQRFPQFQGKVLNKKLQIPLPANFFTR
ncbi:MAG: helix-turn-helix transcriptional regulator [Candidatus Electrothrix sp. Rat3]|nr:helix-turn-helix transcriptional regulator [Candidatus Electrothrix rattekaaiensis]